MSSANYIQLNFCELCWTSDKEIYTCYKTTRSKHVREIRKKWVYLPLKLWSGRPPPAAVRSHFSDADDASHRSRAQCFHSPYHRYWPSAFRSSGVDMARTLQNPRDRPSQPKSLTLRLLSLQSEYNTAVGHQMSCQIHQLMTLTSHLLACGLVLKEWNNDCLTLSLMLMHRLSVCY